MLNIYIYRERGREGEREGERERETMYDDLDVVDFTI
jgi:hypothetical protein